MTRDAIVVFAKRPEPGRVKTRMSPPLTPVEAAELYAEMLADVLAASDELARLRDLDALLCVDPADAGSELARGAPSRFAVTAQHGPDLAARMTRVAAEAFAAGRRRVLLRGSDSPHLELPRLEEVLDALDGADVALLPDLDGGYSAVALAAAAPGLFDHAMSTGHVLDDTRQRAEAAGLRVRGLEPQFDLDTVDDLRRLAARRAAGCAGPCPRTLAWLDRTGLWPDRPGLA